MRSLLSALLIAAAVMTGISVAVPSTADAAVTRTTRHLNLRHGPGVDYRRVTTIPPGQIVNVVGLHRQLVRRNLAAPPRLRQRALSQHAQDDHYLAALRVRPVGKHEARGPACEAGPSRRCSGETLVFVGIS